MNILFLCHRIPFPLNKGEKIRVFNMIRHLSEHHTVFLGTFVDDAQDMQHLDTVHKMVSGRCRIVPLVDFRAKMRMFGAFFFQSSLTAAFFQNAAMRQWVNATLRSAAIDRVIIFSTAMAPYLLDAHDFSPKHVIFDMEDIDSEKWNQYAKVSFWPRAWVYRREARLVFELERRAARSFGSTMLVSPLEAKTFAQMAPETGERLHTLPVGVDLTYFAHSHSYACPFPASDIPIVMTGRMDYRPNVDAALWFAEKVLPIVRKAHPSACFYAVGARPSKGLNTLRGDGVVITGTVDDVRPYLAHAAAVVAPLRIARGIQNKILEALAMQKPVVATSIATQALGVKNGMELWVADDPDAFAQAVIAAISGPDNSRIAIAGRRHVEENYDLARVFNKLDILLADPSPVPNDDSPPNQGGHSLLRHTTSTIPSELRLT